jgi:hypothetical protein
LTLSRISSVGISLQPGVTARDAVVAAGGGTAGIEMIARIWRHTRIQQIQLRGFPDCDADHAGRLSRRRQSDLG